MEQSSELVKLMGPISGILISAAFFAMLVLIVYFPTKARNKERLALIEKGVDVTNIYKKREKVSNGHTFFKIGVILVGVALGLFVGMLLSNFNIEPVVAYFSMILLFGGTGILLANYMIEKKK